ncbi:MAG: serine/threonine protein kinase [Proteobacteria bacterium]|nr:serine/threonine protein kinase [Pseudomonadota bacterium]
MTDPSPSPYALLTPDHVLDALDALGFAPDGRLLQLNSYENRVWQAHTDGGEVVVAKFYRPGRWSDAQIAEEHAFALALAEAEVPVVAPLALPATAHAPAGTLARWPVGELAFRVAVSPRRVGQAANLEDPEVLRRLGHLMGRVHAVGRRQPFAHRRPINVQTLGWQPREALLQSPWLHPATDGGWPAASAAALELAEAAFARHGPIAPLRLHGDAHAGNLLWREDSGPHLVDLDDCASGPAVQDLWMLLPGEQGAVDAALAHLLAGYRTFAEFDERELALIEPLRTLRLIHHSAWIAARWDDPAFPPAFPWFEEPHYWARQAQVLRKQVGRMGNG